MKYPSLAECKTQNDINCEVDSLLGRIGELQNALGETYMETATRLEESHPGAAAFLRAAENRWFELGK